jgi:pimeloyl-ACP methyl ester carboxylesterase
MATAAVYGIELYYVESGAGEPVLLIPGLGATAESFGGIVPRIAERYRSICVDLRGVGRSTASRSDYTMELWANDLVTLLDHLEIPQALVIGSSLGGCVAQVLAAGHPDRVSSLVLAASFSEVDRALELNYRVRIGLVEALGLDSDVFGDYVRAALFGRSFLDTEAGDADSTMAVAMLRENDPDQYVEHLRALLRFGDCDTPMTERIRVTTRLGEIRCPTLVMCGDEDVLTVPALSARIVEHLPNATLVMQQGCGHANLVEQPGVAAEHIVAFLDGVAAAANGRR